MIYTMGDARKNAAYIRQTLADAPLLMVEVMVALMCVDDPCGGYARYLMSAALRETFAESMTEDGTSGQL